MKLFMKRLIKAIFLALVLVLALPAIILGSIGYIAWAICYCVREGVEIVTAFKAFGILCAIYAKTSLVLIKDGVVEAVNYFRYYSDL